jgi:AcrR family transcriptional regulator
MTDVAKAAGVSRQTLYNTISGRQELIEAVVVLRIEEMSDELRAVIDGQPTFVDAIVETSLASVELARKDPELTNLVETATTIRLFEIIAGPFPAIHEAVASVADYVYILHKGRIAFIGDPADCQQQQIFDQYLGTSAVA